MLIRSLLLLLLLLPSLSARDVIELRKELAAKEEALAADDVEARHDLAKWCHKKKLRQSELRIYRQIVKLAPDDEKAREALGHVSDGDNWYDSVDAMNLAAGRIKRLKEWVEPAGDEKPDWTNRHGYWLTPDELNSLKSGEPLLAHETKRQHEVLTREFHIVSFLKKETETLELARVLEQAFRIWRDDADIEYDPETARTMRIRILKDNKAFVRMMEDDIESFGPEMAKSQGFFDGQQCWLSYFHDWYRTRRVLLHEARHQFDILVLGRLHVMPGWYKEGTAEYWSMHSWDGNELNLGELVPEKNYSLHFCAKLLKKDKIRGVEETLTKGWWGEVEYEFYQNAWAFVYYLRNSNHAEGFRKWEAELFEKGFATAEASLEAFKGHIAADLEAFDETYLDQLEQWAEQSPDNMR